MQFTSRRRRRRKESGDGRAASIVSSLLSVTFVVLLLTAVVAWHGNTKEQQRQRQDHSRFLQHEDPVLDIDDDDSSSSRTETCKKYLYNFLNGTTDARDECQGFYNAYKAADCENDTDLNILGQELTKEQSKKNDTTDDDVLIDDFFENWECCDSIRSFYERNCENTSSDNLHSVRLLGIMLVLLVCTMIKAMLKQLNIHWLPDACAFILVGTAVGGVLRIFDQGLVARRLSFDNDLFLQIMLPPIIFQAALSIDKQAFRRDLFPILAFAGLGTAFSSIAIGLITHQVSKWGVGDEDSLPLLDSLVFGSLISSIDPVATLSILAGVGVSQTDTLYTLIFGESLLNDGVAIVLFDTLKSHLGEDDVLDEDTFREMVKHFCAVLFGSIGIGLGVGMCCTLYFWILRGRQTAVTEVAIFFCWALIPYYIADGLGCSGIISIMVMGFFMDYYVIGGFQSEESAWMDYMAMRNENENGVVVQPPTDRLAQFMDSFSKAFSGRGHILSRSRHHVGFVAHVISSIMDTAIFAYLGLFLFNDNVWNLRLNMTAILSCVSSRAVMVVALSLLINIAVFFDFENTVARCFRSFRQNINLAEDDESIGSNTRVYLDKKTQLILLLAGVRGAVSFALVENIPVWDTVTKTGSKFKAELKTMTSSSIVFTLFVFGVLTYITVKQGSDPTSGGHIAGNLTRRLLSEPLDSDDDGDRSDDIGGSNSLEIDGEEVRPTGPGPSINTPDRYRLSGE